MNSNFFYFLLLFDYITYFYYLKQYNIQFKFNIYIYRIILRILIWIFIYFNNYIYINNPIVSILLSILIFTIEKIYFYNNYNHNINFMCVDIVLSVIYIFLINIMINLFFNNIYH